MRPLNFKDGCLELLDQRKLPFEQVIVKCCSCNDVAEAIKNMTVRGAPAIGVCAAYGLAMGALAIETSNVEEFISCFYKLCDEMAATRPTAVNLFWAIDRMKRKIHTTLSEINQITNRFTNHPPSFNNRSLSENLVATVEASLINETASINSKSLSENLVETVEASLMDEAASINSKLLSENLVATVKASLINEAACIDFEDVSTNRKLGINGEKLIKNGSTILTHCNAGALATADFGTALGVIRACVEAGKQIQVFADETRPFLQGARLTAFELVHDNIPVTLICDNMAGHYMKKGIIDYVITGADRIAANGDTANKIGTYMLAVLARENNIPFYIAAPTSTIDMKLADGNSIPIEERPAAEVTHIKGFPIAPEGIKVGNPAFDITEGKYITGIITEKGVVHQPYEVTISQLFK